MTKTKEPNYVLTFSSGIAAVLLVHYFILLKFNLHPTVQVFISFILFWIWLSVIAMLSKKTKG